MSLRTMAITALTILGLFGCASADPQSGGSGEERGGAAEQPGPAATTTEGVESYPGCNSTCYSRYYAAEANCDGNATCLCMAQQNEGACLAACAGRVFIRRFC